MVKTDFTDACEWIAPRTDHQPTMPVPAWYRKAEDAGSATPDGEIPALRDMTTIGTGGKPKAFHQVDSEDELVAAVREADRAGNKLLVLGGGSNLLCGEDLSDLVVVQDLRTGVTVTEDTVCGGALVSAPAGQSWDEFVCACIDEDQMGLEALSGIPGTVGAAPVQNIGAYGHEVAETLSTVRVFDRLQDGIRVLPVGDLQLGYRTSIIKRSLHDNQAGGGRSWGYTGRYVVLSADFQLAHASLSAPIEYQQLADKLGVKLGERADMRAVRQAVLELRRSKGMVLDLADPDTRSCGSFFTNPIISSEEAKELPPQAPRFPVFNLQLRNAVTGEAPKISGLVKTSAAWLISHAGLEKGFATPSSNPAAGAPRAALSSKHVLALTNRNNATSKDIVELARAVQDKVKAKFNVDLEPEPVWVAAEAN
ncbi:UDP-N-acetylmuramate dehydrogenase [Varibaculum vaginae]|uniref:UDP-N-acetylmuramate dehydrogenase n=1 Tax=Varibaculum vaginae TaxID=2364797 RepID=UPI001F279504|nr:UDP-N-acetylmuramate dehydrogenase [Varibaculum vaginae]